MSDFGRRRERAVARNDEGGAAPNLTERPGQGAGTNITNTKRVGGGRADMPFEWMASFDESDEPVFIHDKEYRILRCNAAYAARAGMPMEEIIGKPYWQVFPKLPGVAGEGEAAAPDKAALETGAEFTTAGGEIFLTRDITAHKESGEFWYSTHSLEDITERKQEESARERASSFLAAVLDSAPGIFTVVDRQGRLVHWNAGLAAATGLSDAQLKGLSIFSFLPESEKALHEAKLEELFRTGQASGETHSPMIAKPEEGPRDFVFTARSFEVDGEPYSVSFSLDKTEVRKLQSDITREKAISDTIIESAPGMFFMIDEQGRLVRWNKCLREETGYSDEQLYQYPILAVVHEDDRSLAAAKLLTAFATGYAEMEVRVPTRDRGLKHFMANARRIVVDGVPHVAGYWVDVTKRKCVEEELAAEKAFSDALIDSTPGAFYVIDQQGNYYRWNGYLRRLTGLTDEELRRRTSLLTVEEQDRPLAAAIMKEAFENGYAQAEMHVVTQDRGVRLYFMTARRFHVGAASYLVGVGIDTTDRRARMNELEHEAQTDPLTQVANRSRFMEIARHEFARCRRYGHPVSLWMLDIDHFKTVNDSYGHHAGDVALKSLVDTSRQALRDWDVMGRMGGEEFAVLLPETDADQALQVAERLRQTVAATAVPVADDKSVRLTVSTGIATSSEGDADIECLLDRADRALYEAKRTGRDKVCVAANR